MKIHCFSFRLAAVLGLLMAFLGTTDAQQLPLRTNWQFNYFQENPAFAGFSDCLELKAGYRQQWAGFDGAPQTAFANLCLLYTSPSPRDRTRSRMPSSA